MAKNTVTGVSSSSIAPQAQQPRASRGVAGKIVKVVLALVLGAALAVGLTWWLAPHNLPDFLGFLGGGPGVAVVSDLAVDANGDNIAGNHMDNLQAGGFVAVQGDHLFYADLGGDGGLCYQPPKGDIVRLTDFPVANLNISGNELVFTDLAHCAIVREDGSAVIVQDATVPELWIESGGTDTQYGGNLYSMIGVKELCEGKIAPVQLLLTALVDEGTYTLSPIVSEGSIIALTAPADPDSVYPDPVANNGGGYTITPMSMQGGVFTRPVTPMSNYRKYPADFTYTDVTVYVPTGLVSKIPFTTGTQTIKNVSVYNAMIYVEIQDGMDHTKNKIVRYDMKRAIIVDTIDGYNLKDHGDKILFASGADHMIYDHVPMSDKFTQVSTVRCDGPFDVTAKGDLAYTAYNGSQLVNVVVSREKMHSEGSGSSRKITAPSNTLGDYNTFVNPPKSMLGADSITGTRRGLRFGGKTYQYNDNDGYWYEYKLNAWGHMVGDGKRLDAWSKPASAAGGVATPRFESTGAWDQYTHDMRNRTLADLNREEMARIYPPDQLDRVLGVQAANPPAQQGATQGGTQGNQQGGAQDGTQGQQGGDTQGGQQGQQQPLSGDVVPDDASKALDALLYYMQGNTNYASGISKFGVYSQGRFAELLVHYGDEIQTRKKATEMASQLESEIGISGRDDELIDAVMHWFNTAKYTVGSSSVSGDTATVTVTIQSQVNGSKLFSDLTKIAQQEMLNYPGGQQALMAKGQDFLLNWMFDVMIKVMKNPADYDCVNNNTQTKQIEMRRNATLGWLVDNPDDLLYILADMG